MQDSDLRDITQTIIDAGVERGTLTQEQADGFMVARDKYAAAATDDEQAWIDFQNDLAALGIAPPIEV